MTSSSLAVRVVANICSKDVRSNTGSNLFNIEKEVKLDPVRDLLVKVKAALLGLGTAVPVEDTWRIGCLQKFLARKYILEASHQNTMHLEELIDSLCISKASIILSEPDTPTILCILYLWWSH